MSNLIQEELNAAKANMLDIIEETESIDSKNGKKQPPLVQLTRKNVAIVEAMIQNDSDYLKSSDKTAGKTKKYKGSTAYWMTMLKEILIENKKVAYTYEEIIQNAIEAIDRENSTHLNADGVGREQMQERLLNISKEDLLTYLKEPDRAELKLINILAEKTEVDDEKHHSRTNLSFASKFCHYACFYLFEGEKEQDNYSIYDNVVKRAIPKYLSYYGINIKEKELDNYTTYLNAVDQIIEKAAQKNNDTEGISRNGFDHLLWYYFKGRLA